MGDENFCGGFLRNNVGAPTRVPLSLLRLMRRLELRWQQPGCRRSCLLGGKREQGLPALLGRAPALQEKGEVQREKVGLFLWCRKSGRRRRVARRARR